MLFRVQNSPGVMNRKERLKIIRTPDTSLIRDDLSSTGPFVSPMKRTKKEKPGTLANILISIKALLPYLMFMVLYTIIVFFILRPSNDRPLLAVLMEELERLKNENEALLNTVQNARSMIYQNYARTEMGSKVEVDEGLTYKYGFMGFRKHDDPHVIFNDGNRLGECLAINGDNGKFAVILRDKICISKIGFYHPILKNNSSAMKDFVARGYKGQMLAFEARFDFKGHGYEEFNIGNMVADKLEIEIMNNHGNKKYTCIYKIVIIGHEQ